MAARTSAGPSARAVRPVVFASLLSLALAWNLGIWRTGALVCWRGGPPYAAAIRHMGHALGARSSLRSAPSGAMSPSPRSGKYRPWRCMIAVR